MRRSAAVYHKFTEDEIRQANSVDILSLARGYGYEPERNRGSGQVDRQQGIGGHTRHASQGSGHRRF